MSEMIEKVAAAIAERGGHTWESCKRAPGKIMYRLYWNMAVAAIEAMSEPTLEMKKWGALLIPWVEVISSEKERQSFKESAAQNVWVKMIDAALSSQEKK